MLRLGILWGILAAASFSFQTTSGATIYVDDNAPNDPGPGNSAISDPMENGTAERPFDAIQQAIDAAKTSDAVLVSDGTYSGTGNRDIDFRGKAITVKSANGSSACIINCQGSSSENHRAFVFDENEGEQSILQGFTILNGYQNYEGGAIYSLAAHPMIRECVFQNNQAQYGSAIFNDGSGTKISDCRFVRNQSLTEGGAILNRGYCQVVVVERCEFRENIRGGFSNENTSQSRVSDCRFIQNTETSALRNAHQAKLQLYNSVFLGNRSNGWGGAINSWSDITCVNCVIYGNQSPWGSGANLSYKAALFNCTIAGNVAVNRGGGIFLYECPLVLSNCILWGNSDSNGQIESSQADYDIRGVYQFHQCCVQGWTGLYPGTGFSEDPRFMNPTGFDRIVGTDDDDLQLSIQSPCIDRGDNGAIPADEADLDHDNNTIERIPLDAGGNNRLVDIPWIQDQGLGTGPIVDIGAYETAVQQGIICEPAALSVPEGSSANFSVRLAVEPQNPVSMNIAKTSGDADLTVGAGAMLAFDSTNYSIPQSVTLSSAEDVDHFENQAVFSIEAAGLIPALLTAIEQENEPYPNILLVDDDAPGGNNGANWSDAFRDLQDALAAAHVTPEVREIRVAQGTYRPVGAGGDRNQSFVLFDGVVLRGAWAGYGATDPDAQDVISFETILSGDLNRNDIWSDDPANEPTRQENSQTIITIPNDRIKVELEGLTIRGSQGGSSVKVGLDANPIFRQCRFADNYASGGGALSSFGEGSDITGGKRSFINCTFEHNIAGGSGALSLQWGEAYLNGCTFRNNHASAGAGGIGIYYCFLRAEDCRFENNYADRPSIDNPSKGGAIGHLSGQTFPLFLERCTFVNNYSKYGGALSLESGPVTILNCTFQGNHSSYSGGAICQMTASNAFLIMNSEFTGNRSDRNGGAIYNEQSNLHLVNCSIVGNTSKWSGAGVYNNTPTEWGSVVLDNSILWGNQDPSGTKETSQITGGVVIQINHSCVQGWTGQLGGNGNIGLNPLFMDADGVDNIFGTPDDNLRLSIYSPCIDAGGNTVVPADTEDLDQDGNVTEPVPVDLAEGARFRDVPWIPDSGVGPAPVVDMGAYETSPQASFRVNPAIIQMTEGASGTVNVSLTVNPGGLIEVNASVTGSPDVSIQSNPVLHFDSSNYTIPQTITLSAVRDTGYFNDPATLVLSSGQVAELQIPILVKDLDPAPAILYVDRLAAGTNTGASWADAFTDLQQALQTARTYPGIQKIYVAQGTYRPTTDPILRDSSFELVSGVSVYGGFPAGGSEFEGRNPAAFPTILSGDILGNDVLQEDLEAMKYHASRTDNSYHVLKGTTLQSGTELDGFIVSGGQSDLTDWYFNSGGGALNLVQSSIILSNCVIELNISVKGGAVFSTSSELTIQHCTIRSNGGLQTAGGGNGYVGGFYIEGGSALFDSCLLEKNLSSSVAGAVLICNSAQGTFMGCTFRGNRAYWGGGVHLSLLGIYDSDGSGGSFNNCIFEDNTAYQGGGLSSYTSKGNVQVQNCTFLGNTANDFGGGACLGEYYTVENCLFIGNSAAYAGGLSAGGSGQNWMINTVFLGNIASAVGGGAFIEGNHCPITQCIFAHNSAQQRGGGLYISFSDPASTLSFCSFYDNTTDGLFIADRGQVNNCIVWGNQDTSNQLRIGDNAVVEVNYTSVENWKNQYPGVGTGSWNPLFVDPDNPDFMLQDYHLTRDSGCIDAGNPADSYADEPQPNGGRANLGRYGGTSEATSTFDDDGDGYSNPQESRWGLNPHSADTDNDGLTDTFEISYDGGPATYSPYDPVTGLGGDLNAAVADSDADGLDDYRELYEFGTNPILADSDADELPDGAEIAAGTNPLKPDTDADGMPDGWEVQNQFNPLESSDAQEDADSDGLKNRDEFLQSCNPRNADSDGDQMLDGWEVTYHLDPLVNDAKNDSDRDGYTNYTEYIRGSLPNSADSIPVFLTYYVDDNAPLDPGPGDPSISDPLADGSSEHPYDSIQKGINRLLAEPMVLTNDTIIVRPGMYTGSGNRSVGIPCPVTIRSENGRDTCVIDCQNQGDGFVVSATQDQVVILHGFTIQRAGSAVRSSTPCRPVVQDCIMKECSSNALWFSQSCPSIENCEVTGSSGNGIHIETQCGQAVITRCVISRNSGRGVSVSANGLVIRNCLIANNRGDCGMRYTPSAPPVIACVMEMCSVINNNGAGIVVTNNSLILDQSIVWNISGLSIRWRTSDYYSWSIPTGIVVSNSDIIGGWAGENNLDNDPLSTMDGHLTKNSPCIDAGKSVSIAGEMDIDGEAKAVGSQKDIGADEFIDSDDDALADHWEQKYFGSLDAQPQADADGDGWKNLTEYERSSNPLSRIYYVDRSRPDNSGDGLSWETAKRTIQAGIDVAGEEDVVMVGYGAYSESVSLSKSIRVRSADLYLRSILDLADTYNVSFNDKTTMNTTLEGFILVNVRTLPKYVLCFNNNSRGNVIDCLFQDYASDAIQVNSAQVVVSGCVFKGYGGNARGIYSSNSTCTLVGCRIEEHLYGAVYNSRGTMIILDSLLARNGTTAYPSPSIVDTDYNYGGSLTIRNCTLVDNVTSTNPTVRIPRNGQLVVENSILWNNGTTSVGGTPGTATINVNFSDIQGGYTGTGNLNVNPGFIRNGLMNDNGTPGTTLDDYWVMGDYHLTAGSSCRNSGNPLYISTSGQTDIEGRPRVLYGRVDMGAYEWMQGDTNGDSTVNYSELAEFAASWLKTDCGDCSGWDYTGDHQVGIDDLDILLNEWLVMPEPYVPGLVADWTLDQNAFDSVSWHHGTLYGDPQWISESEARVGSGSVELDGDDWIQMAGFKGIGSYASRTCTAWIRTSESNGEILWWGDNTTAGGMWRMRVLDGKLAVQINGGLIQGSTAVNTGQWVHVAAILPAGLKSSGDILLYVNGIQEDNTQKVVLNINTKYGEDVRIGADFNGHFFVGQIDDVRIYNRAISWEEVVNLAGVLAANAGPDRKISSSIGATNISLPLAGKIINGSGAATSLWSQVSGSGETIFEDAAALNTQAIFPIPGKYTLRLTVTEGQEVVEDNVAIFLSTGEVGYWGMDGDYSDPANGYTGTPADDPVFVDSTQARVGSGAMDLDGNDSVVMNGFMGINGTKARTCMAWIKTMGVVAPILYWGDKNTAGGLWDMRVSSTGRLRLMGGGGPVVDSVTVVNTGRWVHVAAVLPEGGSSAANIQLYVNGVRETEAVTAGTINTKSGAAFRIGTNETGLFFTGLIDDVRIYDRALTAAEIASLASR